MTLIEVVAGLALMATLLVAMLMLKTRFTHQMRGADVQLRAVAAADSLLTAWWANPVTFPVNRSGVVTDFAGLNWQTKLIPNDVVNHLDAKVIRLDILDESRVVASVDVMLPLEKHHAQ